MVYLACLPKRGVGTRLRDCTSSLLENVPSNLFTAPLPVSMDLCELSLPLSLSHSQTALPVPSPVSGVIEELFVPDGEKVNAGDQLCKIRITGVCMHAHTCKSSLLIIQH